MNTKTVLLVAGAVAIPVAGLAYYQHVKSNYDITFQGVNVTSIDNGNINLNVRFLITNSTGMRVTIFDSKFLIYANGVQVGIAQQAAPLVIPTNMITMLEANVMLDKGKVGTALFDFLFAKIMGHSAGIDMIIQGPVKLRVNAPVLSWFTISVDVDESYSI